MTNFLSEFQVMRQIFFFIFLFGFLGWCVIFSKNVSAEQQYTEIEVVDGGNVIGNVKYVGDLGAVVLNLYRDWELSDTSKILSEKLIFSKINNGLKNAAVSVKDITKGKKKGGINNTSHYRPAKRYFHSSRDSNFNRYYH